MLNQLSQEIEVSIMWVKAHVGHKGNERADEEARNAVNLKELYEGVNTPHSYTKKKLWEYTYNLWTTEWENDKTCRMTKLFLPQPDKNKSKQLMALSRGQMRRLIELITGHNNLNYFQSKIYPEDVSPLCRFCEEEDESFEHLLNECPCFLIARREILQNRLVYRSNDWSYQQLLEFSYIPSIEDALTFN